MPNKFHVVYFYLFSILSSVGVKLKPDPLNMFMLTLPWTHEQAVDVNLTLILWAQVSFTWWMNGCGNSCVAECQPSFAMATEEKEGGGAGGAKTSTFY